MSTTNCELDNHKFTGTTETWFMEVDILGGSSILASLNLKLISIHFCQWKYCWWKNTNLATLQFST